jgi:aryl-alcohol dehydrogenase-like predicted oxidoreductase
MDNITKEKLVLGTAGLAGIWGPVNLSESIKVLHRSWEYGIRYTDTAPAYAAAETLVSKALKSWKGEPPVVSTKVGKRQADHPDAVAFDYNPAYIRESIDNSRKLFNRDILDIVFLHDPGCMPLEDIKVATHTLLELKQRGSIRALGIGGNYGGDFRDMATSGVFDYFMGYNRYNLIRQSAADEEFIDLGKASVKIWQASPLYMGLLGSKFDSYQELEPSWIPAEDLAVVRYWWKYCEERQLSLTGLALNYVHLSSFVNRMVLGASTMAEWENSIYWLEAPAERNEALKLLREINPFKA